MNRRLVVMIEDDPDIRELLSSRVRRLGYEVETATTGEAGIRLACELEPAVVVIDIGLPDVDGWRVIDQLAGDERTAAIPVVVASIVDPKDPTPKTVRAHLVKPIKRGVLEEAVADAVAEAVGE